jgi:hypothetical protein
MIKRPNFIAFLLLYCCWLRSIQCGITVLAEIPAEAVDYFDLKMRCQNVKLFLREP